MASALPQPAPTLEPRVLAPVRLETLDYGPGLRRRAISHDYSTLKLRPKTSLVYGGKGGTLLFIPAHA